jgi:uncharacterized membrane protein (UPF0127 family)
MRFPIDVVFLDAELRVLQVVHSVAPWRAAACRGAKVVLELAAGECLRLDVEPDDRLEDVGRRPLVPKVVRAA